MIAALVVFFAFICAVVAGIVWLLRSDTNAPDTALSLYLAHLTLKMRPLERGLGAVTRAAADATRGFNDLARAFARAGHP